MITKPQFIEIDPNNTEQEMIKLWEQLMGRQLFPAQPERIHINQQAYWHTIYKSLIDYIGTQNLIDYADGSNLDKIGKLFQATRLIDTPATTTLEFTLNQAQSTNFLIPKGTRVGAGTGVVFATKYDAFILRNTLSVQVEAEAEQPGGNSNGFTAGEINQLLTDSLTSDIDSVQNTDTSSGGNDTEPDDRFRERLKLAASLSSTAGAASTYEYHALSASPSIQDIQITQPNLNTPELTIYVLARYGVPSDSDLAAVETKLNDDNIRPLTDQLTINKVTAITYSIDIDVTIFDDVSDSAGLKQQIVNNLYEFVLQKSKRIKADILLNAIISASLIDGVYDVTVISPSSNVTLNDGEWAENTGVNVDIIGTQTR